ncbi:MAG: hypothetical protein ACP5UD_10225, partial [Conexivisphaera sp.]
MNITTNVENQLQSGAQSKNPLTAFLSGMGESIVSEATTVAQTTNPVKYGINFGMLASTFVPAGAGVEAAKLAGTGALLSIPIATGMSYLFTGKPPTLGELGASMVQGAQLSVLAAPLSGALGTAISKGGQALGSLLGKTPEAVSSFMSQSFVSLPLRMGTGALSNVALTLPFTQNPQQLAFSAVLGAGMSIDWAGMAGYHLLPRSGGVTERISDVTLLKPSELRDMGVNVPKGTKWIGDILQDRLGYQLTDDQLARLNEIGRAAYKTEKVTTADAIIFKDPSTGKEMIQLALGQESLAKGMPHGNIVKWSGAGSESDIMATHVSPAEFKPGTTLESATPRPLDLTHFYLAPQ